MYIPAARPLTVLPCVDPADGGRAWPVRVGDAEGVCQALSLCGGRLGPGRVHLARVGHALRHHVGHLVRPADDKVGEVESQLQELAGQCCM